MAESLYSADFWNVCVHTSRLSYFGNELTGGIKLENEEQENSLCFLLQ